MDMYFYSDPWMKPGDRWTPTAIAERLNELALRELDIHRPAEDEIVAPR
jgi:hypothetical protein